MKTNEILEKEVQKGWIHKTLILIVIPLKKIQMLYFCNTKVLIKAT